MNTLNSKPMGRRKFARSGYSVVTGTWLCRHWEPCCKYRQWGREGLIEFQVFVAWNKFHSQATFLFWYILTFAFVVCSNDLLRKSRFLMLSIWTFLPICPLKYGTMIYYFCCTYALFIVFLVHKLFLLKFGFVSPATAFFRLWDAARMPLLRNPLPGRLWRQFVSSRRRLLGFQNVSGFLKLFYEFF